MRSTSCTTRGRTLFFLPLLLTALLLLLHSTHAALPLNHLTKPTPLWNQAINSPPGTNNMVQISPDDRWIYVTSSDGSIHKLDPIDGEYVASFAPERRNEDGNGGLIGEEETQQWVRMGTGGISFHMYDDEDDVDGYLIYWVFDIPPPITGLRPKSRVVAIKHEDTKDLTVLWIKNVDGIVEGTPVIGSEGKFIYFTMNALATAPSPPSPPPTNSPIAPPTNSPTPSPTTSPSTSPVKAPGPTDTDAVDGNTSNNIFDPTEAPVANSAPETNTTTTTKLSYWWVDDSDGPLGNCVYSSDYPSEWLTSPTFATFKLFNTVQDCCASTDGACQVGNNNGQTRNLRDDDKSGRFMILSYPQNGETVYEFSSRSAFGIQQHNFAALDIAHDPDYGNYNGGGGNSNDVLVWASLTPGGNAVTQGDTLLFQLPKGFDAFDDADVDTSEFAPKILESVPWVTNTRPTLSKSGLDVYFVVTGNQYTGWNKGKKFDRIANLGPTQLPPQDLDTLESSFVPIVLAADDTLLLVTSTTRDAMFAIETESGTGILWTINEMSTEGAFTTARISPDGEIVYFGKDNSVHSINLSDGTPLWGKNGYSASKGDAMRAEISISSTGEFLYYNSIGSTITGLQIADVVPTASPVMSPSGKPSFVASQSPSASMVPSLSIVPTITSLPSVDPDYIPPSTSPTTTLVPTDTLGLPSTSPSVAQSASPSTPAAEPDDEIDAMITDSPVTPPTASPVMQTETEDLPTASPVISTDFNPSPSAAVEDNNVQNEDSSLSTTAIIGIAVGGGIGLILLIAIIWYICKKKSEDDGVDTSWQQADDDHHAGGVEEGTTFQYGAESNERQSNLQW